MLQLLCIMVCEWIKGTRSTFFHKKYSNLHRCVYILGHFVNCSCYKTVTYILINFIRINRLKNTLHNSGDLTLIEQSSLEQQRNKLQQFYQYFAVSILSLQVSIHRYITYLLGSDMGYNIADKTKTKKPASVASYNSFNMLLGTADSTQVGYLYYITHSSKYCSILYIKASINACIKQLHTTFVHNLPP